MIVNGENFAAFEVTSRNPMVPQNKVRETLDCNMEWGRDVGEVARISNGGPNFSVQSRCLGTDEEVTGLIVITVSGDMTDLAFTLFMNSVDKSRWVILAN
jgi:hypothetical protein